MPEIQVVTELVEGRGSTDERASHELVPQSEGNHRVAAWQVRAAACGWRDMALEWIEVGVWRVARRAIVRVVRPRLTETQAWLRSRCAPCMRVQHVMEQTEAVAIEPSALTAGLPDSRSRRIREIEFLSVIANRRVTKQLQTEFPSDRPRVRGELACRNRRITCSLLNDLASTRER